MLRSAILLAFLFAICDSVPAERLPVKTFTTTDGLPSDIITRIVRDSRGFLWFCTPQGLSRFDGYKFTNYGLDQGLPNRHVNDVLETRSGIYWVATSSGVCRFSPDARTGSGGQRFVSLSHGNDLGDDPGSLDVSALCEDRTGSVWFGTDKGLYRLDRAGAEWTVSRVELPRSARPDQNQRVISIIEDRHGFLWVSTYAGLYLNRLDGRIEFFDARQGVPVRNLTNANLLEDSRGSIWLGTNAGLCQLISDPPQGRTILARTYTAKDGLATSSVSCLFRSSDGRVWVGNWTALSEFLPSGTTVGQRFIRHTAANGVGDVLTLCEDRDGNLWIGSETHGATKVARSGFVSYGEGDGLGGTRVSQISEDRSGELCAITTDHNTGFISRYAAGRFTPFPLNLAPRVMPSFGWYQGILQDATGEWWIATSSGLLRYHNPGNVQHLTSIGPKAIYTTRDGLGTNAVFRIFEDSRRDIWIGTVGNPQNTLGRWQRSTDTIRRYSAADGIPQSGPTAFCEDRTGNIWIGFGGGGLARYRGGRFTFFTKADGLPEGFIFCLYLDQSGRLWVASGDGGVARLDDPTSNRPNFITYTTADGLSTNQATSITEDRWGRVYVGTGRGVDRIDPANGHVKHYTTADGLASNYVNVSFRDRTGTLWFGTLDGLSRFIPEPDRADALNAVLPSVLIGGLRIAGEQRQISELGETSIAGLKLGAAQNQLQIDFFGLSFAPGELLRYQYRLEGADKDWGPLTDQRSVNYAHLSPGSYHFLVRAVSSNGLISPLPATIAFVILPPVWRQWWFIGLVATATLIMLYSVYRYRVARLIELERIRTRIATDLHDDIGSSLSQVAVLSEVVRRRAGSEPGVSEPLSTIAGLSRDLVDSMNDIVWAINPGRDYLSDVTQRMRRFASDVFTAREIQFSFSAPDPQLKLRLGADVRREVFLIFKESVNNAIRHSECTRADIEFLVRDGWLELSVRDNGKGFDVYHRSEGNGLSSMKQRAAKLCGALEIRSSGGRGTTVILRAPTSAKGQACRASI
jgi:ligand-binding sensor domain-containing protein/two-component sensor histidine kinase